MHARVRTLWWHDGLRTGISWYGLRNWKLGFRRKTTLTSGGFDIGPFAIFWKGQPYVEMEEL